MPELYICLERLGDEEITLSCSQEYMEHKINFKMTKDNILYSRLYEISERERENA